MPPAAKVASTGRFVGGARAPAALASRSRTACDSGPGGDRRRLRLRLERAGARADAAERGGQGDAARAPAATPRPPAPGRRARAARRPSTCSRDRARAGRAGDGLHHRHGDRRAAGVRRPAHRAGLQRHAPRQRAASRCRPSRPRRPSAAGGFRRRRRRRRTAAARCRAPATRRPTPPGPSMRAATDGRPCRRRGPRRRGAAALPQVVIPGGARDAHLRAVLEPGSYYVLVDEAEPFGVGGDYTLKVTTAPPLAQSSCSTAQPIQDGISLASRGAGPRHRAGAVLHGRREAARPLLPGHHSLGPAPDRAGQAVAGDRPWSPVMQLLTACSQAMCLATDRRAPTGPSACSATSTTAPPRSRCCMSVGANTAGQRRHRPAGRQHRRAPAERDLRQRPPAGRRPGAAQPGSVRGADLGRRHLQAAGPPSLFYSATLLRAAEPARPGQPAAAASGAAAPSC